ncbi:MAG: lytic murein transglycosylase [Proteobacteria bacterium]|nr:lytic murein transglycosylase [Pseudomonadota bacterium]
MNKKIHLSIIYALCSMLCFAPLAAQSDTGEFDLNRWNTILNQIQDRAIAAKVSNAVINDTIQNAVFVPQVVARDMKQVTAKPALDAYLAARLTPEKIGAGVRMGKTYPTLLKKVEKNYGVPRNVILSFWALETNYGTFKGNHKISDSFVTLVYDGRREKFFIDQLISLMKLATASNLPISAYIGSWDGGLGHFQFMPSTLEVYGVDGNNDGEIDVVNNISDAMCSAGNYLSKLGWDNTEKILREVTLPDGFDPSMCDGKTKKTLDDWAAIGITNPDGTAIPSGNKIAGIVCDAACCAGNSGDGAGAAPAGQPDAGTTAGAADANNVPAGAGVAVPPDVTDAAAASTAPITDNTATATADNAAAGTTVAAAPTPTKKACRAFLTYANFYRIKKWNNSNSYAIAIALLSEELK